MVSNSMANRRKDYFDRFKGEMYNIHQNYRELQESTNENLNKLKLKISAHKADTEKQKHKLDVEVEGTQFASLIAMTHSLLRFR